MGDSPFIKFFPSDFLAGTSGLSLSERGVYITILCLIYETDGPIRRDDDRLARRCGARKDAFRAALEALIDEGKLSFDGTFLFNRRAGKAIKDRQVRAQNATAAAKRRWQTSDEKNQQKQRNDDAAALPAQCEAQCKPEPEPEPDINSDAKASLALIAPEPASPMAEAVAVYNEAAGRVGWQRVQKITPTRSKHLRSRLSDVGGVQGWRDAIERAEASDFLCGRTGRSAFRLTFDWLVKQANFVKLMEGNYDNRADQDRTIAVAAAYARRPSGDVF